MNTKIVTWLGNGEERIDFEGESEGVTFDDKIHVSMTWMDKESIKFAIYPPIEFQIVKMGEFILTIPEKPDYKRNIYSAEFDKIIRQE